MGNGHEPSSQADQGPGAHVIGLSLRHHVSHMWVLTDAWCRKGRLSPLSGLRWGCSLRSAARPPSLLGVGQGFEEMAYKALGGETSGVTGKAHR